MSLTLEQWESDWRNRSQEAYLYATTLFCKEYHTQSPDWTHDHCEFCWATFSDAPDDLHWGYTTMNEQCWICPDCYDDLSQIFQWHVHE